MKLGKLAENPIRRVDKPRIDRRPKVRFLYGPEEARLREAICARDLEIRQMRQSANTRIASLKMLPVWLVASPEMLPAKAHANMMSSQRGRLHETQKMTYATRAELTNAIRGCYQAVSGKAYRVGLLSTKATKGDHPS